MTGSVLGVRVLEVLDAAAVRRWSVAAVASLEQHSLAIDRLNVFPVADSDTGTNLAVTLRAAADALAADPTDDAAEALRVLARGAVLGASGNSGSIVAQLLRALAEVAATAPACDAAMLRRALVLGADQARAAVANPVEGTVLTVAAAAAAAVPTSATALADVASAALVAADLALARTPDQLPALARAGVVDAGAQGLVLLLGALVEVIGGEQPRISAVPAPTAAAAVLHTSSSRSEPFPSGRRDRFEVQYLLEALPGVETAAVRARLTALGDSVVVGESGDATTWSVHVHTADIGAVVEAGMAFGRPHRVTVAPLPADEVPAAQTAAFALVSGLDELFAAAGVETVEPSVDVQGVELRVRAAGQSQIVLLPLPTAAAVAEQAAHRLRGTGLRVAVVPISSAVQGLAAVAVHDPARRFDDDVVAMAEAAAATRVAEVVTASDRSLTTAGIAAAGDTVGLIDGEVVEIGRSQLAVGLALLDRLLGVGAELVTILLGADARSGIGEVLQRHVRERSPLTEVAVYDSGRPAVSFTIGVE